MFNLKEIETAGAKVGVVLQSVKDVVQSLIDDNMIETDKIGSGNFLWALPSKGRASMMKKIESLDDSIRHTMTEIKLYRSKIQEESEGKEQNPERKALLEQLADLKEEEKSLKEEMEKISRTSKSHLTKCYSEADLYKSKANQWTDNIFEVKSWLKKKNPALSEEDIDKNFNIPSDFDTLS